MNNGKRKNKDRETGKQIQLAIAEMFLDNPQLLEAWGYDGVRIDGTGIVSKNDLAKMRGQRAAAAAPLWIGQWPHTGNSRVPDGRSSPVRIIFQSSPEK